MADTDNSIRIENHSIITRDKTMLAATLYRPKDHNHHTVLISGAMGMPQRFYRHYATFLAEKGCVVLTFDFRGIALSKHQDSLWGYEATLTDWASQDLQAMLKWLQRQYPDATLTVVGHSLGGHLLGAAANITQVSAILGVSVQNTYWRNWSAVYQGAMFVFWFMILPILSYGMGYFPSRWFGLGEALPKKVALNWAQGASKKSGNKGLFHNTAHDHYAEFIGATRFYSFEDDGMMAPVKAVDAILDYYPNARQQERQHVIPKHHDVEAIGHSGFFRPKMRDTLWQESLDWLLNPAMVNSEHVKDMPINSTDVATSS